MSDNERLPVIKEKEINQNNTPKKEIKTENKTLKSVEDKLNKFINSGNNSPKKVQKISVEDKLNKFINSGNNSPKKVPKELKKIKKDGEEYDFSCSIDEVRTNWRGVEKEDRRKCYVKVLNDRLILYKTGIMIQSDLGSRTIYFSDISSVDFDKSGVFHVTNSIKLIMRGGEFITLIHAGTMEYELINNKWNEFKENQHNTKNSSSEKSQSNADELIKYADLYEKGLITEEEFNTLKQKLIGISNESSVKYCGNCGAEVSSDFKFCTECGSPLN